MALRPLLWQAGLAAAYAVAGAFSLLLAFDHPSASPVWAGTGIALAAGLLLGRSAWPAIFVGAFVLNVTTAGTVLSSLGIALGNTLEGIIGVYAVKRWARGRAAFERARSAFRFVMLAGFVGTTTAATIGVASLWAVGSITPDRVVGTWITWWLGDASGALIVAPAILLWTSPSAIEWDRMLVIEAAGLALALVVTGALLFVGESPFGDATSPSAFLTMPLLMWAAFRFGPRGAITAVLVLTTIAIKGALDGGGPFLSSSPNRSLLLLQTYTGIAAATTLVVAASINQRRRAEEQLRAWSSTDPLTGLANHRQLTSVMERELQRSGRTGRSFSLLLLDLDHLKRINDRDGHLVGSRAIVRVAEVLRKASRAVDTTARYGGDEFAVVMPESDEADARSLADRISALLAADEGWPPLSVSIGAAVAPRDGSTVEALIDIADTRMYAEKKKKRREVRADS